MGINGILRLLDGFVPECKLLLSYLNRSYRTLAFQIVTWQTPNTFLTAGVSPAVINLLSVAQDLQVVCWSVNGSDRYRAIHHSVMGYPRIMGRSKVSHRVYCTESLFVGHESCVYPLVTTSAPQLHLERRSMYVIDDSILEL